MINNNRGKVSLGWLKYHEMNGENYLNQQILHNPRRGRDFNDSIEMNYANAETRQ